MRNRLGWASLACVCLALAACEGPTIPGPASPRLALCGTSGECGPGDGRDPPTDSLYSIYNWKSGGTLHQSGGWNYYELYSESRGIEHVASSKVRAEFLAQTRCFYPTPGTPTVMATRERTLPGYPVIAKVVYPVQERQGADRRFIVNGTHTFTAEPGYSGGGTYTSSWMTRCG